MSDRRMVDAFSGLDELRELNFLRWNEHYLAILLDGNRPASLLVLAPGLLGTRGYGFYDPVGFKFTGFHNAPQARGIACLS